ncbi:MAG: hypothetical protein CMJ81_09080 [Planctomycetaceae bacterium]|nr:hypothetical protein [Planctomycetaceae bacterium]MBP60670.1 hypothetical protein [Planctomycetaceae bacterium]
MRELFSVVVTSLFTGWFALPAVANEISVEVSETAGVRRASYPVSVAVRSQRVPLTQRNVQVLLDGIPLAAQVDTAPSEYKQGTYLVDFHATFVPFQSRRFRIRFGDGVQGSPLPEHGHVLRETDDHFLIVNAPHLTWKIPRNLSGLLTSMNFPPCEHIRKGGAGLYLVDRTGTRIPAEGEGDRTVVLRRGPSVVHLRFSRKHSRSTRLVSQVDLIFPVTRSWVEVVHRVLDPEDLVAELGCELQLNLNPATSEQPTLVDFGAGTQGYMTLRAGQTGQLLGGTTPEPWWKIQRGTSSRFLDLLASAPGRPAARGAEGWAHVMDRERCLALAVDGFGKTADDRITTTSAGQLQIVRSYAKGSTPPTGKQLRSWLHFVFYPPQVSAATCPQAMQNPLAVTIVD